MERTSEVIDVWFDSGSMPFAQYHHPFENQRMFEEQYPADMICEGIDQTRGWFYSLLAVSTSVQWQSSIQSRHHRLGISWMKMDRKCPNPKAMLSILGKSSNEYRYGCIPLGVAV